MIQGPTGLFIAMPAKRRKDGTFKDLAHPLNAETRAWLERQVLDHYTREVAPARAIEKAVAPKVEVK